MNIIVCIKQVPDTESKIRVKADGSGIETTDIKWIMNPYDEFAVEEALKLRDKMADGSQVTAITVGPKTRATEVLRTALAMGADNAVVINTADNLDSNSTAAALAGAIKKESGYGVVFTGKQAIDDDCAQVSQIIAEYLGVPHSTVIIKFDLAADKQAVTLEREVEGGSKEVIELKLPSVVGANKGLNSPRYASLPGIMKAKKKEIKEYEFSSLGVAATEAKISYKGFQLPPARPASKLIDGDVATQSATLVKLLREEAKVI